MSIAISIVEDQRDMRESLVEWLGGAPGLRCVGAHASAEEALRDIPGENPDVVLMDINLPNMNGIQCVARLKDRLPKTQVLMLTTYAEGDMIFDSLRAGANGYLLKNMPREELVEAVQQVHAGGAPMSLQIARKVINHFGGTRPTHRPRTRHPQTARQRLHV
jgi:DNA-binding NarL/FixJ family response regulator